MGKCARCPQFWGGGEILAASLVRWGKSGMGGPTGCLTLNTLEWPSEGAECLLSDVLETGSLPQKYYLSPKACQGILRRAKKRGKMLPLMLQTALEHCALEITKESVPMMQRGGGNVPFVQKTIINTFALQGAGSTSQNANGSGYKEEQSFTLNVIDVHGVVADLAVRRLTPIECERLQGFPDNYTNIKENCPDGPRYKALGNSMAVPVMKWIGERIERL